MANSGEHNARTESNFERFARKCYADTGGRLPLKSPACETCVHYVRLRLHYRRNWGVCINAASERDGLLTFRQDGCAGHQSREDDEQA